MTGISVEDLSYSYGAKQALDGVCLEVGSGQFAALLGPNGAGKSTLFALLTRLFTAPEGRISVGGHDLKRNPRAALAEIGVVFQQPTLDLDLSVRRNLGYFAALHGIPRRQAMGRMETALERLDMAERAGERVRDLNGGHRRRVEIARALMHSPSVLLLDESTVGLDVASRTAIVSHVHELARDGMAVLWATHLTDEILPDDQLVILHRGKVLASGVTEDLTGETPLPELFLSMTGEEA